MENYIIVAKCIGQRYMYHREQIQSGYCMSLLLLLLLLLFFHYFLKLFIDHKHNILLTIEDVSFVKTSFFELLIHS